MEAWIFGIMMRLHGLPQKVLNQTLIKWSPVAYLYMMGMVDQIIKDELPIKDVVPEILYLQIGHPIYCN